jgi:thioredoxin 1
MTKTKSDSLTIEITDDNFDAEVLKSAIPVLIDAWATWCGPCKHLAPTIDALADQYAGKLKVGKVDVDANHDTAKALRVSSIPALFIFKDGLVVWSFVGAAPKAKIDAAIKAALA